MKRREKRIFVYGGPPVFYATDQRPSGHPNAPAYVLETEHLRVKAQRDRLLELGKGLLELADYEYEPAQLAKQIARGDLCPVAKDRLDDLRAAIAECEEGPA